MEEKKKAKLLSPGDVSVFCSQIALILKAAIPLEEGISAICENVENARGLELCRQIEKSIGKNGSLSAALRKTGVFPAYMVNMADIGERSGKLDSVMDSLALFYEREEALKNRMRSALLYPFLLVLLMAAVIGVLLVRVLPVFNEVFRSMGSELSGVSAAVMNSGMAIGKYALAVIAVLGVLLLCALLVGSTPRGSQRMNGWLSNFPLTRRLSDKVASARFASVMSMLLSSGYDTSEALELIPNILTNKKMIARVRECKQAVDGGKSFAAAVGEARLFPGLYASMVSVGAKTGSMDTVMERLAKIYSEDVEAAVDNAVSVIEPVIVAILSLIIGAILLSVMMPLMGVMSSIG